MERRIVVLYGSQTGTAEEVAERIFTQSRGSGFRCTLMALDEYLIQNLVNEEIVIFVCSTTGQGEPPDNMKKFWRFVMRKNLPSTCLCDLKYGVLALGDSSYAKYNFVGKKLHRRIQSLGGCPLLEVGLADDQHDWGADAVVDVWVTEMWKSLLKQYPTPDGMISPIGNSLPPPRYKISKFEEIIQESNVHKLSKDQIQKKDYSKSNPYFSEVKFNKRVTSDNHFQETRLVSFDIGDVVEKLKYVPGDAVMIKPSNVQEDVEEFLDILPFDADTPLLIEPNDKNDVTLEIPQPITLRSLATHYFDFKSVPRRNFFQLLSQLSDDENEKEKLAEFGSPEGTDERYSYANRPRRNILEVLQDFHLTCLSIPLDRVFDVFPLIRPRAFSIASSPLKHKGEIQVLVAVVRYKTRLHKKRLGLCSYWLSKLEPGDAVPLWVKSGGIRFPSENPCIMVGPGTGIAPFRSEAHQRTVSGVKDDSMIFFGCRSKNSDFYFEEEWEKLDVITHVAFSRDQEDKVYVQDKVRENSRRVYDLILKKNAHVYVAGNSKNMPDDVKLEFSKLLQRHGNMTSEESSVYLENMQRAKRYQQETWS